MRPRLLLLTLLGAFLAGCAWEGHAQEAVEALPLPPGYISREVTVGEPERRGDEPGARVVLTYPTDTRMWKLVQDLRVGLQDAGFDLLYVREPSETPDGGSSAEQGYVSAEFENKYALWRINCGAGRNAAGEAVIDCTLVPTEKSGADLRWRSRATI